jgi:hypothetical protein
MLSELPRVASEKIYFIGNKSTPGRSNIQKPSHTHEIIDVSPNRSCISNHSGQCPDVLSLAKHIGRTWSVVGHPDHPRRALAGGELGNPHQ